MHRRALGPEAQKRIPIPVGYHAGHLTAPLIRCRMIGVRHPMAFGKRDFFQGGANGYEHCLEGARHVGTVAVAFRQAHRRQQCAGWWATEINHCPAKSDSQRPCRLAKLPQWSSPAPGRARCHRSQKSLGVLVTTMKRPAPLLRDLGDVCYCSVYLQNCVGPDRSFDEPQSYALRNLCYVPWKLVYWLVQEELVSFGRCHERLGFLGSR